MVKSLQQKWKLSKPSHHVSLKLLYMLSERRYVFELTIDLGLSRQEVNLHLKRLQKARFVESDLKLEDYDPRAKKFFKLKEFEVSLYGRSQGNFWVNTLNFPVTVLMSILYLTKWLCRFCF